MSRLKWLNDLAYEEARAQFLRCCGSMRWAEAMARARPFRNEAHVYAEAGWLWSQTGPDDWRQAIANHAHAGDALLLTLSAPPSTPPGQEPHGVQGANPEVLRAIAEGQREYEAKFGFFFVVNTSGRSAEELLTQLQERLKNPPALELRMAAGEQALITRRRLERLLTSP